MVTIINYTLDGKNRIIHPDTGDIELINKLYLHDMELIDINIDYSSHKVEIILKNGEMNDKTYGEVYTGLNIASSVATVVGRLGMRAAGTTNGEIKGQSKPYARVTEDYNTVQYDGNGKPYWSIHNTNHYKSWITNPHWHTGAGGDGNHFKSYWELLKFLIIGG